MTQAARDLIMWIGSTYYKTWRLFADEAAARGVCKRVRNEPKGIVLGVSKCYLIHGERVKTTVEIKEHSWKEDPNRPLECRYCLVQLSSKDKECVARKVLRVTKPKSAIMGYFMIEDVYSPSQDEVEETPDRGCGSLAGNGLYIRGPLTELETPIPWLGDTFVGYRYYQRSA